MKQRHKWHYVINVVYKTRISNNNKTLSGTNTLLKSIEVLVTETRILIFE